MQSLLAWQAHFLLKNESRDMQCLWSGSTRYWRQVVHLMWRRNVPNLGTLSLHPQECEPCPVFVRGPELHILSTSPVGSSIIGACVCNSAKGLLPIPLQPGNRCVCGVGKLLKNGECEPSPGNTYQPNVDDALGEKKCTSGSISKPGSTKNFRLCMRSCNNTERLDRRDLRM